MPSRYRTQEYRKWGARTNQMIGRHLGGPVLPSFTTVEKSEYSLCYWVSATLNAFI